MDDVDGYICTYAGDDLYIRFAWNGKYSDEFLDINQMFRRLVMERVLQQPDIAKLSLLRDLFRAETQWSAKAWCVDLRLGNLASLMLACGGAEVVDDFLEGRWQSFDTYCECGTVDISPVLAQEICAELTRRLTTETDTKRQKQLQDGIKFFGWRGEQSTKNSSNQHNL